MPVFGDEGSVAQAIMRRTEHIVGLGLTGKGYDCLAMTGQARLAPAGRGYVEPQISDDPVDVARRLLGATIGSEQNDLAFGKETPSYTRSD